MITALRRRLRDPCGISSVEVMVSMMIMATVVMGAAATSTTALHVAASGQQQSDLNAAVQYQLETLLQDYDALGSGSAVVDGYAMKWEVTGNDPKKIVMYIFETSTSGGTATLAPSTGYTMDAALSPTSGTTDGTWTTTGAAADTVVYYLADPTP